ncbi:MAG: sulfatase [Planctomycetes bacterium]|nr:sulfatase [Planctomycetota bacterium]
MRSLLALAALSLPQALSSPPPQERANPAIRHLVVITLDTVRADLLKSYGHFRETMPALERYVADAWRFERCYAPISHTTPSHASLFTSTLPYEHGVVGNSINESGEGKKAFRLATSPTLRTLAQALQETGHRTGGFVAATPVKRFTGLDAGFDHWTEPKATRRPGAVVVTDALRFLERRADADCFAWLHLFDAHGPFQPAAFGPPEHLGFYGREPALEQWLAERRFPEDPAGRSSKVLPTLDTVNQYAGSLRFLDAQLAPLFERLQQPDLAESTLVAIVADHGQGLGQHGFRGHGIVWNEQLHVPFFLKVPGRPGRAVATPCSSLDVVPTLLGFAPHLVLPAFLEQLQGADLLAPDFVERPLFACAPVDYQFDAVVTARFKLVRKPGGAADLYDLAADPYELKNVAAAHPQVVAELTALLDERREADAKRARRHQNSAKAEPLDPELARELDELGYGAGGENRPADDDDGGKSGGGESGGGSR